MAAAASPLAAGGTRRGRTAPEFLPDQRDGVGFEWAGIADASGSCRRSAGIAPRRPPCADSVGKLLAQNTKGRAGLSFDRLQQSVAVNPVETVVRDVPNDFGDRVGRAVAVELPDVEPQFRKRASLAASSVPVRAVIGRSSRKRCSWFWRFRGPADRYGKRRRKDAPGVVFADQTLGDSLAKAAGAPKKQRISLAGRFCLLVRLYRSNHADNAGQRIEE